MYCLLPSGAGPRDLRPYGPGGRDVCAECTFNGPPDRLKCAEQELGKRLLTGETLILDDSEGIGPRRLMEHEKPAARRAINAGKKNG